MQPAPADDPLKPQASVARAARRPAANLRLAGQYARPSAKIKPPLASPLSSRYHNFSFF